MTSELELYTTTWSFEAADPYGNSCEIIPLPSNLSGVQSAGLADFEESRASSSSTASYAKLHHLDDGNQIILRVLEPGNALQLQGLNSGANAIFLLPDSRIARIIPEVSISLTADNSQGHQFQVIFLAELGVGLVAYRLLITQSDLDDPANLPTDSRGSARWCTEQHILPTHVVNKSSPVMAHVLDKTRLSRDTLALSMSDGTLLKIEWLAEEGRFRDTALSRQQSLLSGMRSFLPGRFGSSPNLAAIAAGPSNFPTTKTSATQSADQVVSMTSLRSASLYTISRDRKLRIWSSSNNNCLETIQLPQQPTTMEIVPVTSANTLENEQESYSVSLMSPEPVTLARLFNGEGTSQYLMVYIPTYHVQASFFILYHLDFDTRDQLKSIVSVLEKPCDFALDASTATVTLKDFIIHRQGSDYRLWTLWNENGQSVTRLSNLSLAPLAETSDLPEGSSWSLAQMSSHQQSQSLDGPAAIFDETYTSLREEIDATNLSAPELAHQITLCVKQAAVEAFLCHLFTPGRYPISAVAGALYTYIQQILRKSSQRDQHLSLPVRPGPGVSLAQQILDTVGSFVRLEEDAQTGAPREASYVKAYKLEFLKVLALSEESKRNAKAPLAFGVSNEVELLVLSKGAMSTLSPDKWPFSANYEITAKDQSPFDRTLNTHVGALRSLAQKASDCLLEADALERFETAVDQAVTSAPISSLDDIAAGLYEELVQPYLTETFYETCGARLDQIARTWISAESQSTSNTDGPRDLASLFDLAISSLPTLATNADSVSQTSDNNSVSQSLLDLVAEAATSTLSRRKAHALQLFILSLCLSEGVLESESSEDDGVDLDKEVERDSSPSYLSEDQRLNILARSWDVFRGLSFGAWLAEYNSALTEIQLETSNAEEEHPSEVLRYLELARRRSAKEANLPGTQTSASLLRHLLAAINDDNRDLMEACESVATGAERFLQAHSLVNWHALSIFGIAQIVATLLLANMDADASAVLSRIPESEEDAALLHQIAAIACRQGDTQTALVYFDKVAAAIYTDDASLATLSQIIDAEACDARSAYYRHAVGLLDDGKAFAAIATICLQSLSALEEECTTPVAEEGTPAWAKDLWYKAFRNLTLVGDFDAAYSTLMRMPTNALRLDAMRHLVAVMCDSGNADLLLKYGFVGLQDEFEKCLSFRARNANPLALPDNYKILYAWQCILNDYRGAAATMYQRAKRLASLVDDAHMATDILTVQCQSYLVAINTLVLVQSEKQWILVGKEGLKQAPVRKKLRLLDATLQDPAHITLEAIKAEYTLSLARLQLSRDFPELAGSGQNLDAHGAVALFSQIGAFNQALQVALALRIDMTNVFQHLALRCVAFDRADLDTRDESWILRDHDASAWGGSLAAKGWKLLQLYLERYDYDGAYRRTVLCTILEEDRRVRLPKSLVDWFLAAQPEHLIWKLIQFDLLDEAFDHAHRMLDERFARLRKITTSASGKVYIPYNLLDQLLFLDLTEETPQRGTEIEKRQNMLRDAIGNHRRHADQILAVV